MTLLIPHGTILLPHDTVLASEIVIKKSRFIARITRSDTTEDARAFIDSVKAEFPDARHHCNAYSVVIPGAHSTRHFSDDGEPSGTAGRPILDVLVGSGIENVSCVVTRYFGGTLLGTGGLVRAYSDSTQSCLIHAPLLRAEISDRAQVRVSHAEAGRFESEIRASGYTVNNAEYLNTAVQFEILGKDYSTMEHTIAEITSGAAQITQLAGTVREIPAGHLE